MVTGEAHELPAFVGMTVFAVALRAFAYDTSCRGRNRHAGLNGVARCGPSD
jgi:hypothetical protein